IELLAWDNMFRLLGFPVHVRPGFVMFMVLIVVLYGDEFGLWLAVALAGFTLLHELGHAVAARRTGAEAEISLNFLAGYASYVPSRPLSRAEQIGISFAGPGIQIVASVAILVAMGGDVFQRPSYDDPAMLAVWWAGPIIGLFNLVPVLPLDGGNIVTSALDRFLPDRAERVMAWFSIAVTGAFTILAFTNDRYRGFILVIGFLLVAQLQILGSSKEATSPWHAASEALQRGKPKKAQRLLTAALSHHRPDRPPPAVTITPAEAAALIDLLPEPWPTGDPWNEYILANQLMRIGRFEDAAHYAAEGYQRHPHTLAAATVARAAGALGDQATAIGWLRTAAEAGTSPTGLATIIDGSPELIGIRQHPDVVAIRQSLTLPHPV
ncbi:MAG: site-2 protease family protein, partial [Ilumatobacteraceae bacterium]